MHHFIYPSKDAFITNQPNLMLKNTGLDEILEVETTIQPKCCTGTSGSVVSRALLQFNLDELSASLSAAGAVSPRFFLRLRCCESREVPVEYTIYALPMATSWVMGTGYKFDGSLESDGVSWKFTDGKTTKWYVSSSLMDCSGGGTWFNDVGTVSSGSMIPTGSLLCSQSFKYQTSDVNMDISPIVEAWLSGSIPNFGLILMHSGENVGADFGKLRFFSNETNTIYQPSMDIAWDDSTFSTGSTNPSSSLDPLNLNDSIVSLPRLKKSYKSSDIVRIDVFGRKMYPQKTFTNMLSDYTEPKYLPSESYYSIKDAETEATILDYDQFTKLSCDERGNYFNMDMGSLPQERYYKISIRCSDGESIVTYESPLSFKITR